MEKIHSRMFYTIFLPIIVWTAFIVYGLIHFVYFAPYQEPLEALSDMLRNWWGKVLIALLVANLYQLHSYLSSTNLYCNLAIFFNPYNIDAHYRRGIHLYDKKEFVAALQDFQEVTRLLPTHPDAFVYVGLIHKVNGEIIDAIAAFTNALNLDSKNWYAYYHRGCCKYTQHNFEGALRDLTHSIEVNSKETGGYHMRGNCYFCLAKYADAIQDYDVVIKVDPQCVGAYENRGYSHYLLDDANKAIPDFDIAIKLDPQSAALYMLRGIAHGDMGNYHLSIEDLLSSAELAPNEVDSWLNLAKAYSKIGETEKTKYYLDKAIVLKPDDPDVMLYQAIHQFNQNDPNALEKLDRLIELHPNRTDFLVTRAQALADMGEYARAIVDLDKIIAQKPLDWKHYVVRAKCKVKNGDPKGAIADCEVILQGDKKNDVLCAEIGQNLRIQNFWDESTTLHQAIVDVSPHCWQAWIGLADSARHLNNNDLYSRALAQTRTWIPKVDPYNLACLESVADNLPLAKEHLLIAFSEKPQYKAWAKEDPDLFWLRQDPSSSELF